MGTAQPFRIIDLGTGGDGERARAVTAAMRQNGPKPSGIGVLSSVISGSGPVIWSGEAGT